MAGDEHASRSDAPLPCEPCLAGRLFSFDWAHANTRSPGGDLMPGGFALPDRGAFDLSHPLRHGTLYQCRACGRPWYLDGATERMSLVPEDRVPLILAWNERSIFLSGEIVEKLAAIGPRRPTSTGAAANIAKHPAASSRSRGSGSIWRWCHFSATRPLKPGGIAGWAPRSPIFIRAPMLCRCRSA